MNTNIFDIKDYTHGKNVVNKNCLSNYFAKSMLPKEKLNKMKTFKNMDPAGSNLDISTLDTFINDQEELIELLEKSRETDLTKIKTSISISEKL